MKKNLINSVSPGVFFYWVKVTSVADANSFTINQTITSANFTRKFAMASGSAAFGPDCAKAAASNTTDVNGDVAVTFTAPAAGLTYYLGIKYDSTSVSGFQPPTGAGGAATYSFSLNGFGGTTSGLTLSRK